MRQARQASDPGTRQRVIEAAIRCILEQGFYRASSNAIAEAAGLTWGVIQYHFGTREALMLAVLEEGTVRLLEDLQSAEIVAETLPDRIGEFIEVLERYYGDPDHLAFIQVLLNLSHDPRTSADTVRTMRSITRPVNEELTRLTAEVFEGTAAPGAEWLGFLFHAVRGLALSELMLTTLPSDAAPKVRPEPGNRRMLAEALALLVERRSSSAG